MSELSVCWSCVTLCVCLIVGGLSPSCCLYRAAKLLQKTGVTFTLTVAKHAADFYGISYNTPSTKVSTLDRHGDSNPSDRQGVVPYTHISVVTDC